MTGTEYFIAALQRAPDANGGLRVMILDYTAG
jgi:hypothetical protein